MQAGVLIFQQPFYRQHSEEDQVTTAMSTLLYFRRSAKRKMMIKKLRFLMIAPFFLFAAAWLDAPAREAKQAAQETTPPAHEIQMTCKKYAFSPNSISVKKGERVRLTITATDHDHGFKLEPFHVEQKLKKGIPTTVEFTADKSGTFLFKCSVFCGFGHGGMKGTLIVEE